MSDAIEILGVTAAYGRGPRRTVALKDVSLNVAEGEIFGLLGPNGAGKSTLLACVEGLHRPEQGTVNVGGHDAVRDGNAAKQQLGVQLQRTALLDDLTVAELVEVYAAMYEVALSADQTRALLQRFGLSDLRGKLARRLSGGQQQRLALALAVANDPKIVLLDEPTCGPGPARPPRRVGHRAPAPRRRPHDRAHHPRHRGSRGAVRPRGHHRRRAGSSPATRPARLIAEMGARPVLKATVELPLEQVNQLPGVHNAHYLGQYLEMETTQPQVTMTALHELAVRLGRSIGDVMLRQPNLEDVFLKLTGRALAEG